MLFAFNALYFGFVHNRWTNRAGEDVLHTELFVSSPGRERLMLTHIHFWVFEVFFIIINMFQYICTIYAYIAIYVYFLSIWYNIIIIIMSIILPFVLLLLHSLPHHGGIEGNKKIRCTAYYHIYLSKHYAFEMRTQFFLVLSGWNQLELPKGTCRKIEGEIWFAACNVAVWFHLELGAGQN